MDTMSLGPLIIGGLMVLTVASLINAIILMVAANWVTKMDVPFGTAFGATLFPILICCGLGFASGFVMPAVHPLVAVVANLTFPVLIQAWVISWRLKVTFGGAALITLVMAAIGLAIGTLVGLIIFVLMLMAAAI